MVILHGPLYHLQDHTERLNAIAEAKRVCKPGGYVLGFAINFTASSMVALTQGILYTPEIFGMCTSEIATGMHNAPENMPGILAEAYYHRPHELIKEFTDSGLNVVKTEAVEGMVWLDKNYFSNKGNKQLNNAINNWQKMTVTDPDLLVFSPHFMAAAKKKTTL